MALTEKEPVPSINFYVSSTCASICRDSSSIRKNTTIMINLHCMITMKWHVHYNTTTNDMNIMVQPIK